MPASAGGSYSPVAFAMISFATFAGTSLYESNCMSISTIPVPFCPSVPAEPCLFIPVRRVPDPKNCCVYTGFC